MQFDAQALAARLVVTGGSYSGKIIQTRELEETMRLMYKAFTRRTECHQAETNNHFKQTTRMFTRMVQRMAQRVAQLVDQRVAQCVVGNTPCGAARAQVRFTPLMQIRLEALPPPPGNPRAPMLASTTQATLPKDEGAGVLSEQRYWRPPMPTASAPHTIPP